MKLNINEDYVKNIDRVNTKFISATMKITAKVFIVFFISSIIFLFTKTASFASSALIVPSDYIDIGSVAGLDLDSDGNIYVVDSMNSKILVFDTNGDLVRNFGRSGEGEGDFITGIHDLTIDNNGYVYVGGDCHVYKFAANGSFIDMWGECGSEDGNFGEIRGINYDPYLNRILVSDTGNNRVQVFTKGGTFVSKFGSEGTAEGEFKQPFGLTTDNNGNIYVVDSDNHRVQKFSSNLSYVATFGSEGVGDGQFLFPKDVVIDSNNRIIVTSQNSQRIVIYNLNLQYITQFGENGSDIDQMLAPQYLALDSLNNIYLTDWYHQSVRKFDSNGDLVFMVGNGKKLDGYFFRPDAVAYDSLGNMYVLDDGVYDGRVQKFTNSGTYIETIIEPGALMAASYYMAIDDSDNLYISGENGVYVFDTSGTFLRSIGEAGSEEGQFIQARGMDFDSDGNIYIADWGNSRVQVFDGDGYFLRSIGSLGTGEGEFIAVSAVLIDENEGVLYVADSNDWGLYETEEYIARIQGFGFDGTFINTLVSAGEDFVDYELIADIKQDSLGNLYVADRAKNRIQYINSLDGSVISSYGSYGSGLDQFSEPVGVAINPENDLLTVVDNANHRILVRPSGTRIFNLSSNIDVVRDDTGDSIVNEYVDLTDVDRTDLAVIMYVGNIPVAGLRVNMEADRDWADVYAGVLLSRTKVLITGLSTESTAGLLFISRIYTPRYPGQDLLLSCPDAVKFSDIESGCTNGYTSRRGESLAQVELEDGNLYWQFEEPSSLSSMSYSTERLELQTEANTVYVNENVELTITPVNVSDEIDSYYVGNVEIASTPYARVVHTVVNIDQVTEPFTQAITFDTPGVYTITAEDVDDPFLSDTTDEITVLGIQDVEEPEEEETPEDTDSTDDDTPLAQNPDSTVKTCEEDPSQDKCTVGVVIGTVSFNQISDTSARVCWIQSVEGSAVVRLIRNGVTERSLYGKTTDGEKYCVDIENLIAMEDYSFLIIVNDITENSNLEGEYSGSFTMEDMPDDGEDENSVNDGISRIVWILIGTSAVVLFFAIFFFVRSKKQDKDELTESR